MIAAPFLCLALAAAKRLDGIDGTAELVIRQRRCRHVRSRW